MATGMALSVARSLFEALQDTEVRELSSMFGYKSRLEDLERTVAMIKAFLLDVESMHQELTGAGLDWVEKLKDALYNADDFFKKLMNKVQQQKISEGNISDKVRCFFSNDNPFLFGFNNSREIKKLTETLDAIVSDQSKFGVVFDYIPVKRREETCSYVNESNIIGREAEKEEVVKLLLSDFNSSPSFVSIVGMGGMGKTTLAQLVFNDNRIKDTFDQEDMYWVCVSEEIDLKEILCKILDDKNSELTMENLHKQVRIKIEGKKYLLVLDDVWEESHLKWLMLKEILNLGGTGSRVLVTTCSREVAEAVDKDVIVYELKGLSDENSWQLFKQMACTQADEFDTDLVKIGHEFVKKCGNNPLSIKVKSSLLYDLHRSKWEEYLSRGLSDISFHDEKDPLMSTLIFSYNNLNPQLRSCFGFCSLFPKDYIIEKELLICLWLAQGYLVPSSEGESMEDVGAKYFYILSQRGFFQDVERDDYGEIHSCKMHILMHNLAQEVAGKESLILTTSSIDDLEKKLATMNSFCRHLRIVHLGCNDMSFLPDEMGNFLQLRYLDVSYNFSLKSLPRSITKLQNLQILNLRECKALAQLPNDIEKLVSLRMLDIQGCFQLKELPEGIVKLVNLTILNLYKRYDYQWRCKISYMPLGMGKLKKLHRLSYFVVGGDGSKQVQKGKLIDLKDLIFLGGYLCIKVGRFSPSNIPQSTKGADILRNAHLKVLEIICGYENSDLVHPFDQGEYQETLLEGLNPNDDLKELAVSGYQGINFPNWGVGKLTFPAGIVKMKLTKCMGLKHLSSVSILNSLKYLHLYRMESLAYIESDTRSDESEIFFPSLEELIIHGAEKFRGWWSDIRKVNENETGGNGRLVDANDNCMEVLPSFVRLRHLEIKWCANLKYFPPCPHLKKLQLARVNKALTFCMKRSTYFRPSLRIDTNPSTSSSSDLFCLEKLKIYDAEEVFNSLFSESFNGCADIEISFLHSAKEITEVKEGFERCASSVRHLSIKNHGFYSLSGGIDALTNLQSLRIEECRNLNSLDDNDGMPWKSFPFLSSLALIKLPKLVNLPEGFQYLSSLQSLRIEKCDNFECIGEFDGSLSSLQSVHIIHCPQLKALPEAMYHLTSLPQLEIIGASSELVNRTQEIEARLT